ncbi:MAG: hypothetical protein K9M49_00785 [Candidatus Marinimicrobia bacterium]|nr:hypothetical protein [Candidatus Neomarinimicrobiota bacterium]MCF7850602.1 hypothetical protein [Candidatus Neomarinimicrobiota bacterium]MCF7903664.1 hypothetical protein [Candidatus Neomarinimicrobiota bacterium]
MKTMNLVLLTSLLAISSIAQDGTAISAQKMAIKTLATQNGFTLKQLDEYLLNNYGSALDNLSRNNAVVVIQAFQSDVKPTPITSYAPTPANKPIRGPVQPAIPKKTVADQEEARPRASILEAGMSKRFYLVDGNIITGTILEIKNDICSIETPDGTLRIPKSDILEETAKITKKDDTRYVGPVLKDSMQEIVIRSKYGDVVINKKDIKEMDRYHGGRRVAWAEEKKTFYQGEAVLTDIFLDPTAFPLPAHTFYISGLSLGYGFTDRFMLRTKFGSNFSGDLNIQGHWRFYHRPTAAKESAAAVGMSLHRNYPMENLVARYSQFVIDESTGHTLNDSPVLSASDVMKANIESGVYAELYYVMSYRRTMESGRGKVGAHFGARTNSLPLFQGSMLDSSYVWDDGFKVPFRLFAGFEYDLSKNMKFIAEVWADNGNKYRSFSQSWDDYFGDETRFVLDGTEGEYSMLDFDFGFLYAVSETFRIGIHFQQPYLAFYWEFYEL